MIPRNSNYMNLTPLPIRLLMCVVKKWIKTLRLALLVQIRAIKKKEFYSYLDKK